MLACVRAQYKTLYALAELLPYTLESALGSSPGSQEIREMRAVLRG